MNGIKLSDFAAISNGKYNLGEISVDTDANTGTNKLVKVNNHRWKQNDGESNPVKNGLVRQLLANAIRSEFADLDPDQLNAYISSNVDGFTIRHQPLSRRVVKSILQDLGEMRMRSAGIALAPAKDPKLSTTLALSALACIPEPAGGNHNDCVASMIVSAAYKAYGKGNLVPNKHIDAEARVQVFHEMFDKVPLENFPTDQELRAMTPNEFFAKCADCYERVSNAISNGDIDDIMPDNGLFLSFSNKDRSEARQILSRYFGNATILPHDLFSKTTGVRTLNLKNLPSLKIATETRINWTLNNRIFNKTSQEIVSATNGIINRDICPSRLMGGISFRCLDNDELHTVLPTEKRNDVMSAWRSQVIELIDTSVNERQAAAIKTLLVQDSIVPLGDLFEELGFDRGACPFEHCGFDFTMKTNDDGSVQLEMKRTFTELNPKADVSFSWCILPDGQVRMDDWSLKL